MAPDTVEKMRDVLLTLRGAMQLFENRNIFEVRADDSLIIEDGDDGKEEQQQK